LYFNLLQWGEVYGMKRIILNALVDISCLITFIPSLISGLVLYLILPSGTGRGGEVVFLGIIRSQWVTMHNYTGLVFAALLIIHLLLHLKFFLRIKKILNSGREQ
jgi:hypothetical protein